jgi:Mg-chelatase subunit ChlD
MCVNTAQFFMNFSHCYPTSKRRRYKLLTMNTVNWDITTTKLTVPRALLPLDSEELKTASPSDPEVIQTACYTLLAEKKMVNKYNINGRRPLYFGAHNGVFRMIPAKYQSVCYDYDPRKRPWFVAGSSAPKDVVLVLDISGSMAQSERESARLKNAKEAATAVIDTLTVSDKIAVVIFNETASVLTLASNDNKNQTVEASEQNKNELKKRINSIEANGGTNFTKAFDKTFDVLYDSFHAEEFAATGPGCNIAVLFLTDGAMSEDLKGEELKNETQNVIALVQNRAEQLRTEFDRETTIFAYSLGDESDTEVMKKIACGTNGIWTHISDDEIDDLITEMGAYYQLFASGLGSDENSADFVAWVEPYIFKSDSKLGTTVSVPVFDRSHHPHLFLGVVGMDVYISEIQDLMPDVNATEWMKTDFLVKSPEKCPKIEPTQCQLDALRLSRGGDNATCEEICNYEGLMHQPCNESVNFGLWENTGCKYC